jgi:hypothetical protein
VTEPAASHEGHEWSVLTKSSGPRDSMAPTGEQTAALLARLPGEDKWTQYPPASGRGHAFEIRFWVIADDASEAAQSGAALVARAQAEVGLSDWPIVRVHAASLDERLIEYYPGLERRGPGDADWSVMHRSLRPVDEDGFDERARARLCDLLGGHDSVVSASGRMVESRFWTPGRDAVDAAGNADAAVRRAVESMGRSGWSTIRVQTASVAERNREVYRGVERRSTVASDG